MIEDEKIFVDRSTIDLVLTDEHVVLEGNRPEKAVKQIVMIKRKPGMSPAEFQDYWLNKHAPLVGHPTGLLRYVQSHARLNGYRDGREPIFDGIATMTYASVDHEGRPEGARSGQGRRGRRQLPRPQQDGRFPRPRIRLDPLSAISVTSGRPLACL